MDTFYQPRSAVASSMPPWKRIRTAAVDTVALAQPAITTTPLTYGITTDGYPAIRLAFGGTAAANKNYAYQVVLWRVHQRGGEDDEIQPFVVAKGVVTLGTLTYAVAGAMGAAANLLADTITDDLGYRGTCIRTHAENTCALLEIDTQGAQYAEVQLDLDGGGTAATTMDVFAQLGESNVDSGETPESDAAGEPFTLLIDGSALGAGLADPPPAASKAEVIGTAAHGVLNCRGKSVARIIFGGTDLADEAFNYQVILWSQAVGASVTAPAWIPRVVAKGLATFGDDVYAATGAGMGAAANFFVDTITDTILDGATVYTVAEQRAVLEIPLRDAERIEIQTDLTTAATVDAFCQVGGGESGSSAVEIKDHDGADRAAVNASNEIQVRDDDLHTLITAGMTFSTKTVVMAAAGAVARTEIVAAVASHQYWVYGWHISFDAAAGTYLLESAANARWGPVAKPLNGDDIVLPVRPDADPIFKCATEEALNVTMAGGGATAKITVIYRDITV